MGSNDKQKKEKSYSGVYLPKNKDKKSGNVSDKWKDESTEELYHHEYKNSKLDNDDPDLKDDRAFNEERRKSIGPKEKPRPKSPPSSSSSSSGSSSYSSSSSSDEKDRRKRSIGPKVSSKESQTDIRKDEEKEMIGPKEASVQKDEDKKSEKNKSEGGSSTTQETCTGKDGCKLLRRITYYRQSCPPPQQPCYQYPSNPCCPTPPCQQFVRKVVKFYSPGGKEWSKVFARANEIAAEERAVELCRVEKEVKKERKEERKSDEEKYKWYLKEMRCRTEQMRKDAEEERYFQERIWTRQQTEMFRAAKCERDRQFKLEEAKLRCCEAKNRMLERKYFMESIKDDTRPYEYSPPDSHRSKPNGRKDSCDLKQPQRTPMRSTGRRRTIPREDSSSPPQREYSGNMKSIGIEPGRQRRYRDDQGGEVYLIGKDKDQLDGNEGLKPSLAQSMTSVRMAHRASQSAHSGGEEMTEEEERREANLQMKTRREKRKEEIRTGKSATTLKRHMVIKKVLHENPHNPPPKNKQNLKRHPSDPGWVVLFKQVLENEEKENERNPVVKAPKSRTKQVEKNPVPYSSRHKERRKTEGPEQSLEIEHGGAITDEEKDAMDKAALKYESKLAEKEYNSQAKGDEERKHKRKSREKKSRNKDRESEYMEKSIANKVPADNSYSRQVAVWPKKPRSKRRSESPTRRSRT